MECTNIIIPKAIENCQLPDPELRNYYVDLENRIFWLDEEVTPFLLELVKYIVRWNADDERMQVPVEVRKPIRIFFFSPGGDLDINYALIDTIKMRKRLLLASILDNAPVQQPIFSCPAISAICYLMPILFYTKAVEHYPEPLNKFAPKWKIISNKLKNSALLCLNTQLIRKKLLLKKSWANGTFAKTKPWRMELSMA